MRLRGRHYESGHFIDLVCREGSIQSIGEPSSAPPDLRAGWIAPAFFDLQINGSGGQGFNSPKLRIEDVRPIVQECHQHGIGGLLPTLVTASFADLAHGFSTLRKACEEDAALARAIPGFHLEGPYISPEDGPRGAHPRSQVRLPNWDEFHRLQEASGQNIRLVTLAPELEGALPFLEKLVSSGVVVSLGHTAASPACIRQAIAAGARLSTHLGNGCHAMLPRHENYLWEQLGADELWASLICDGHHLPPALVRCMVRVKTPARIILTCDASSLAGLPPGKYREWDQELEILPEGKIIVAGTPFLAGSWAFTDRCVANVIAFAQISLADAIDMASARPRQLLDLPPVRLQPGDPADLILFDWQPGQPLVIKATILDGKNVISRRPTSVDP